MKSKSTRCIILGKRGFSESDKLVSIYTEAFGKLKVIAKGARRLTSKFTGHLETLNIADISLYFGPRNIILTEISTIKNFKEIRENLEKLNSAMKIAEITNSIVYENQSIDNLIQLMEQSLKHLIISEKNSLVTHSFMIKFLDRVGIIPNFKEIKSTLSIKYQKYFEFLKKQPLEKIESIVLSTNEEKNINKLLKSMIENETQKEMKSLTICSY